ncbi:hypothetical protein GEMRC1_004188 [Eukaryota sp. GEM-RC1]
MTNPKKGSKLNKPKREPRELTEHDPSSMDSLLDEVRTTVESYFEPHKLRNDTWLQSHMDDEGYVPLILLASFEKVKSLPVDTPFIEKALQDSELLMLSYKGDSGNPFVRLRNPLPADNDESELCEITKMSVDSSLNDIRRPSLYEISRHSPRFDNDLVATSLPSYAHFDTSYEAPESWKQVTSRRASVLSVNPEDDDDDQFDMDDLKDQLPTIQEKMMAPPVTRPRAYSEADTIKQSLYSMDALDDVDIDDYYNDPKLQRLVVVTPKKKEGQGRAFTQKSQAAKKDMIDDIESQLYYFYDSGTGRPEVPQKLEIKPMEVKKPVVDEVADLPEDWIQTKAKPIKASSQERRDSVSSVKSSSHVSHQLLEPGGFEQQTYLKFRADCIRDRQRLGPGKSRQMNSYYRFLCYYLRNHLNMKMYNEFKNLAVQDYASGYSYGLQCVFRFASFFLEKNFSDRILKEFMDLVEYDYFQGNSLYGLEKFVAFLVYRKDKYPIKFSPRFQELLDLYPTLDSFPSVRMKKEKRQQDWPTLGSVN